jgi:hypothetical protein
VIVVLDTNGFLSDPGLGSTAWRILAQAAGRGDVRLCTTEVVLLEAAAGYGRRVDGAIEGFLKWETRHTTDLGFRDLGFQDLADEVRRRLSMLAEEYATRLRAELDEVPAEVLPFPSVDHRVLVQRAADRVPPCKKDGTGYRDTLNWFSLLEVAKDAERDDTLLWVSDDGDFASPDGSNLIRCSRTNSRDRAWARSPS